MLGGTLVTGLIRPCTYNTVLRGFTLPMCEDVQFHPSTNPPYASLCMLNVRHLGPYGNPSHLGLIDCGPLHMNLPLLVCHAHHVVNIFINGLHGFSTSYEQEKLSSYVIVVIVCHHCHHMLPSSSYVIIVIVCHRLGKSTFPPLLAGRPVL